MEMLGLIGNEIKLLQRGLTATTDRQSVIAANIANESTPHYKEVNTDFNFHLQNAMKTEPEFNPNVSRNTNPKFFPISFNLGTGNGPNAGSSWDFSRADAAQPALDGNTVNLDKQVSAMADNGVRYNAMTAITAKEFEEISAAVRLTGEGR